MDEDLFVAEFEGVVAVQVGDFVGEIELVLRSADTIFPAVPQAGLLLGKIPLMFMHIKPNPLRPY